MGNKEIETKSSSSFYVIMADRDGVKKYVSKDFPYLYQYTIKINRARRFNTEELAQEFVDGFNNDVRRCIDNPIIKKVFRVFSLVE